jgi:hypothetical protein
MTIESVGELWLDKGVDFNAPNVTSFACSLREVAKNFNLQVSTRCKCGTIKVYYTPNPGKYNWDAWLDGEWHIISFQDITCAPPTFITQLKQSNL